MGKELLGGIELNRIYQMDCLEGMKLIPDKSINMILCDLPYGTTACKWDAIIPFEPLWKQYERIIKDNGAIVLFGSEPFSSSLRTSNIKIFKYDWYWKKSKASNFANAKKMPMKDIEIISVFYKHLPTYNPQGIVKCDVKKSNGDKTVKHSSISALNGGAFKTNTYNQEFTNYPKQLLEFNSEGKTVHPTQKPVELCEYLLKTYTNEGEIVLDNCMGSGTTAVACTLNKRKWIGFETEPKYIELANKRLEQIQLEDDLKDYE